MNEQKLRSFHYGVFCYFLRSIAPSTIIVVNHQSCLTTIDTDIFAGNEACLVRTQE